MAQHDYTIANGGGAAVRSDINDALQAIITQNSGPTEPTVTRPYMLWNDTTAGALKIRNATDTAWVLFSAFALPDDAVTAAKIAANAVGTSEIADSAVTSAKIANASVTAAKLDGAQTGSAPIYAARAWVNFNGTGTVAIRASGNVSSITDNGVGDYTVNFTNAMQDANYSLAGMAYDNVDNVRSVAQVGAQVAGSRRIQVSNPSTFVRFDSDQISVVFFR